MSEQLWTNTEHFITNHIVPQDGALSAAVTATAMADMPTIQVAPNEGKLLHVLARAVGARRILEIGTLGGYSTIWLARALAPGGKLITLEANPKHAEVAGENIARARVADAVEIRVGPALETLPKLADEGAGPFDFIFLDGDKENNAAYFAWAVRLARPGSLIVVDNVVRDGRVADLSDTDAGCVGVRKLFDAMRDDPRVAATAIQTVGSKGWDGFAIAVVL